MEDYAGWCFTLLNWPLAMLILREMDVGANTLTTGTLQGERGHGRFWWDDSMPKAAECLRGENGRALKGRMWHEVLDALRKDVPEALDVIEELKL